MFFSFRSTALAAAGLFFSSLLMAQIPGAPGAPAADPVSDAELEVFVGVYQELQVINDAAQNEMVQAVEAESLSIERFTEIQQSQQNPQANVEASEEELKHYEAGMSKIMEIQMKTQESMIGKIEASDMSVERYQQIAALLQNDPQLQQRIQKLMQG